MAPAEAHELVVHPVPVHFDPLYLTQSAAPVTRVNSSEFVTARPIPFVDRSPARARPITRTLMLNMVLFMCFSCLFVLIFVTGNR